ncbi:MAG: Gfo/Idh/MocA family oxidoreductase [Geminicoccaceae bacterium]
MQQKPISVAVVGCGYWGKNLVRNFSELGALGAISDPNPEIASKMSVEHGAPAMSFDAVLGNDGIDAVAIAAPAELHAKLCIKAMRAGKHVFVEKPLALTLDDGQEVLKVAEQARRTLMVGHLLQYHPAFVRLSEVVRSGRIGKLQYIYSNRLNLGKIRREENVFWSFAPHDISMVLALTGEMPDKVDAHGSAFLNKSIPDSTMTHLRFPSGVCGHIFVSWLHPFKEQKLVVIGDDGMAVFDDTQPWERKLGIYPHKVRWENQLPTPEKADFLNIELELDEPLRRECDHFLESVATGQKPLTGGEEALRVLKVLCSAQASLGKDASVTPGLDLPDNVSVHNTACVDQGAKLGAGTKIWHFSHILKDTRIGDNCVIGQNVMVGPDVRVGHGCKIQNSVSIYRGVVLEDGVFCGPSCVFTNVNNPRATIERKDEFRETVVGQGATIGANATIVCGNQLGAYCLIGAGAVVTKAVPAHALMVGNPARRIGWVSHDGERLADDLECKRSGRRYRLVDQDTLEELTE